MEMLKRPLMKRLAENRQDLAEMHGGARINADAEPRSHYRPHQGAAEIERRWKRLAKAGAI